MKTLISLSAETSGILKQLQELKEDDTPEGTFIRNVLLGTESAFDYEGPRNFRISIPKPIPAAYKRKYPDVCFAIQALSKHVGARQYFSEWEKAKKILTFKTKEGPRTLYRFWHLQPIGSYGDSLKENVLDKLRNGETIELKTEDKYDSYTRNNKLFSKLKEGPTLLNIATEAALQTNGRGTFLVTRHKLVPTFNIFWFLRALKKASISVFGKHKFNIPDQYIQEREIIAKSVKEIKPSDVECYYKNAQRFELHDKILKVFNYEIAPEMIEYVKNSASKYSEVDLSLFGNSLILTSLTSKKPGSMYNYISDKSKIVEVPELSKVCGMKIYAGIWK